MATTVMAQKPLYTPGDGVYIAGLPADQSKTYNRPVMVAQAYKATLNMANAKLASMTESDQSRNISRYVSNNVLDLSTFMGVGRIENVIVRNFDGDSYCIGDNAPSKTWSITNLVAGYAPWGGRDNYTLGVYDHWDCPVGYDADEMIVTKKMDKVTVDFGNPHEGLVCQNINFNLVSATDNIAEKVGSMKVTLSTWDAEHSSATIIYNQQLKKNNIRKVKDLNNGLFLHSVYINFPDNIILDKDFEVSVEGFASTDVEVWIPRAIDPNNLYPTHTTYSNATDSESVASTDVCLNIDGYFNYIGMWGWYDGKVERGEVVPQGDYVQVYYDPSDPDWPGRYYTGEAAFPIECTFGINDIALLERPDWISEVKIDASQWDEYECLQIIMTADALPAEETGRYGEVIISTQDMASFYKIRIRQGNATFPNDSTDGINNLTVSIPAQGGLFDLSGRRVDNVKEGQIYILNGKKYVK